MDQRGDIGSRGTGKGCGRDGEFKTTTATETACTDVAGIPGPAARIHRISRSGTHKRSEELLKQGHCDMEEWRGRWWCVCGGVEVGRDWMSDHKKRKSARNIENWEG